MTFVYRCIEMLINEQIRRYNETMEKIKQVESAEADAHNQLKLKRQNTVRSKVVCLFKLARCQYHGNS